MLDSPTTSFSAAGPIHAEPTRSWTDVFFGLPGILVCAAFGLLIGIVLQQNEVSDTAVTWVGTLGDLFLRAVTCLVAPLVFCSLVESLLDLFEDGRAARVSKFALLLYALTTVVATCEGLTLALVFRGLFNKPTIREESVDRVALQLACGSGTTDEFLHHFANGSIACIAADNATSSSAIPSVFWAVDVNGSWMQTSTDSSDTLTSSTVDQSITDTLQTQLHSLVPQSLAAAFVDGDLLSIVTFGTLFTIALAAQGHHPLENLANVIRDLNAALMRMISWIVRFCTPVAILSLLAKAIGGSEYGFSWLMKNAGLYILCELCTLTVHMFVFYPTLLRTLGRTRRPFSWLGKMAPAQVFAFGCASSMATLPVVMATVEKTRIMPPALSRFLLSIGATIGKDGSAAAYPVSVMFLASAQGFDLSGAQIASVALLAAIGSVATGPVPSAGIIMVAAIWRSVTGSDPPMEIFSLIVGTDWLLDRFETVVNVMCDTVICRIIAAHVVGVKDEDGEVDRFSIDPPTFDSAHNGTHSDAFDSFASFNTPNGTAIESPRRDDRTQQNAVEMLHSL